jgi:hypothetical protein
MGCFIAVTPVLRWRSEGITVAGLVGSPGNGINQLNRPVDVVPDRYQNFYIAEMNNARVQKYLFNTLVGTIVAGTGTAGSSSIELINPSRVIFDSNENLYVTDNANCRVQFYKNGARNGTTVAGFGGKKDDDERYLLKDQLGHFSYKIIFTLSCCIVLL